MWQVTTNISTQKDRVGCVTHTHKYTWQSYAMRIHATASLVCKQTSEIRSAYMAKIDASIHFKHLAIWTFSNGFYTAYTAYWCNWRNASAGCAATHKIAELKRLSAPLHRRRLFFSSHLIVLLLVLVLLLFEIKQRNAHEIGPVNAERKT